MLSVLWAVVVVIASGPDEVITNYQTAKSALGDGDRQISYDDLVRASQNAADAGDQYASARLAELANRAQETPDGNLRFPDRISVDRAMRELQDIAAVIFAPILVSFTTGVALLWAIRGFRKDKP